MSFMLQTEEERQLRKMVQREKKLTRRKEGDNGGTDSAKLGFNPQELRSHRFLAWIKFNTLLLWFAYWLVLCVSSVILHYI